MSDGSALSRRRFLGAVLGAGGAALAGNPLARTVAATPRAATGPGGERRNVLLLISDDHGLDQAGCYGNPVVKTPSIDRLASEGVRFTHAFTVAASCSPSRSTILTGLYPHQNGQYGLAHDRHHFSLFDWVRTLPTILSRGGYRTALIGKLHVEPASASHFDFVAPSREIMGNRNVSRMAELAGEFFAGAGDQPFFLLVGFSDPHRSREGFGNEREYPGVPPVKYDPEDVVVPPFLPDEPEVRQELADMYQSITRMDAGVGMVLDELRRSGHYDDTLIIYISDNGIPFPGAKTNLYDPGVRLPMIVRAPGLAKPGSVNRALVSFVDLVPTILEWTQVAPPDYELPGRSFLSVLAEESPAGWDEVYLSHTFHEVTMYYPMRGVRTRGFKYIQNLVPELEFPFASDLFRSRTWQGVLRRKPERLGVRPLRQYLRRPPEELYDLREDPNEVNNLAGDTAYADVLEELRSKVHALRQRTRDKWLILENYRVQRELY